MIFAGPVFAEWYWAPVLFAVFFGPFILATAAILTGILAYRARRRGEPLTWPKILGRLLGLAAAITLLVLGAFWAKQRLEDRQLLATQAAAITFQTYEPDWVFPGYAAERVRPVGTPSVDWVDFTYRSGADHVWAQQLSRLS